MSRDLQYLVPLLALVVAGVRVGAEESLAPVAALRAITGITYVSAGGTRQLAEPLTGLARGDVVEVTTGTAVVLDLRCGSEQQLGKGSRYVVPETTCAADSGLLERVGAAIERVRRAPAQAIKGATRGGAATFPDGARFAPDAAIVFRWDPTTPVAIIALNGPEGGTAPTRYRREQPAMPMPWPDEEARRPGKYTWEVRGADNQLLGSATFTILTTAEASKERLRYRAEARRRFGEQLTALGEELLAAADGCFLK